MTDLNIPLPPALRRALELLGDPPTNPDVGKGYLDLLGTQPVGDTVLPKLFASPVGSMFYDNTRGAQAAHRNAAADRVAQYSARRNRPGRRLRPR